MEYLEDLLITADLQINTMKNDYIYLSLDTTNNISYFKTSYFIPEIFMKDEISMKNIGMKWNETSFVKIPKDIHLLGKVWLTVKIPYFQIIEKLSNTTQTTTNNATINQMIFDNHMTYLIMYEHSPGEYTYYLIPDLFLKQPELNYNTFQFQFNEVKEYFIDLTGINIDDNTNIIFYSFNMNNYYSHDIIPLLLNLCDNYDKITLQKLLNNYDAYKQNLLTQNSFDNYITKIIEDDLINEYQNINKFDTTIDSSYYNFMGTEFGVLYNNKNVSNSDITLIQNYIDANNINTVNSIDSISQDAILKTPLVYEYLITNLNPSFVQTYTFYKKITTILTDSIYEYELTDANLVFGSGTITSNYPTYFVDITTFNLPFTLTTDMIIKTIDGLNVVYSIIAGDHKLVIDDIGPTILDTIKLVINTNNNTLNNPNINVKYLDVNSNSEWTNNLLINLDKLDYNKQLEVLLFYEFKKNYYSKESIISNDVLLFSSSVNSIKTFWIELKVVQDRFDEKNALIGFNNDDYLDAIYNFTNTTYPYIVGIENYPQDVFNVYSVVVYKLFDTLKKKYFTEYAFLRFFYNKINSYIYQRNKKIRTKPNLPDYIGLLFYFNIDLSYYIDRNIIKNYLLELFHMESYIAYIPTTGTSLTLSRQDINYYLESTNNNFSDINNYFHELKYVNRYQLLESFYTLLNVGNKIAINKTNMNYLYYKSNLVEFELEISNLNAFLNVTEYSVDDTYVYLTYDTSNYNNTNIINNINYFYVNETIKMSVPMMYEPTTQPYTTAIVTVYDKLSLFNAFISYNQVNVNIVSGTAIIMKYTKNNSISTYKCSVSGTTLINPNLPTNYNDYDLIQMISILLPTTNLTITDSDCAEPISNTYPIIKLNTSSLIYYNNNNLFVSSNTFKVNINDIDYPVTVLNPQQVLSYVPGSFYFNSAINSYITVDGSDSTSPTSDFYLGTSDFTIDWFQYQTDSNYYTRIFGIGSYPYEDIALQFGLNYSSVLYINGIEYTLDEFLGPVAQTYKNKWTHFAIVRTGGIIIVYLDGVQFGITVNVGVGTNIGNSGWKLTLGNQAEGPYSNNQYGGYITNFRWTKGTALYTGNFTIPSVPLTDESNTKLLLLANSSEPYLDSSSVVHTLTNINTIWSDSSPSIPPIIYLNIYDNTIKNLSSINLTIFNNTKLPNLYNYTSLNNQTCETNDYMIQKPLILPFVDLSAGNSQIEPNTNFFILTNVPRMKVFDNYSSKAYLDTEIILNVYSLYSNQLLRNGTNLYSTYYDSNLLSNNNNIDDIENVVTHVYNGVYADIYGNVVSVIEEAQSQYISSYTEILQYISSGSKFGITLQNIEKYAELLNNYTLTSNISTIKLSLYDAPLVDFDNNTLLATGLWNFTNRNNNMIKSDYDFISVLANKYNNSTMKIVNSLWGYYVPYVKINPMVIQYLDRYSSYATNMNNNLIANKSALILVNNKNFPQEFNEEYQMRDKYYHLATDTNKFIINSSTLNLDNLDPTNKSIYISKATIDGKNVSYDGSTLYTTEDIEPYKFKPYYKEKKYDNMNIYYKLVGAVRFESNAVINTLTLPDYIIADNLTIIKTFNYENIKTFDENFYGINYNSRELVIGSSTTITSGNINTLPFSFYLYKFSFIGSDPFIIGTKYLVSIDEQTGYLIKDSNYVITLLIGKKFVLNLRTTIKYASTTLTNAQIFSYVYNNTSFNITSSYVFTEFELKSIGNYNKYFNSGLGISSTDYIMFDSNNNLLYQVYGFTLITILDKFFINVSVSTNIKFYAVTNSSNYLPPIKITKSSISYFSTYEEIIKNVDNKNYWLFLKNTSNSYEFQIKDLETQTISNGNYLVYFCNNTDKPIVYSHPDTFRFGDPNFSRYFNFNPFTNKLTGIGYSGIEHPDYYYINTFSYTYKSVTITINGLTQYTLPQNSNKPLDTQDSYLYPQRTYFTTNIRYKSGSISYNRPIMITNELPDYDYQYYYTNYQVPGSITFIGDSLIYLTKSQYQALSTNTVVTNIKSISTPTSWITTTLTSLNNFITVDKITDGSGDKIFQFKIIPNQLIPFDTYNLITFTTGTKDIYLWLYIDSASSLNPHKFIDTSLNIPMIQPLYYVSYASNQWKLEKKPSVSTVYATYEYTDAFYFDNNTSYIEIADYSFNVMVRGINDTYTTFYDSQASHYPVNAYDPTVQNYNISRMNEWSYINNTTINNQFIDDLTLQKFNLFIFKSSSDNYYFNIKKNNNNTGIELESSLEIGDYDVYIYNYEPIFINLPITYNIDGTTAYIYIPRTKMQRNEVIRIGYYYVQIIKWSEYYYCYTGNVLFSADYVPVSNGYYSLGIFTNYLTRNTFLKGTNYNYHEYVFASSVDNDRIEVGDYYIENNELKQYTNDLYIYPNGGPPPGPEHIFKLPYGNYVSIIALAYFGAPQTYYYDGFLFDIKPGYTIAFTDDTGLPPRYLSLGYGRYPVMITSVANNTITFNPTLAGGLPFTQNYIYLPYQPFEIQTITINNNVISGMTFTGWIQISRPKDTSVDPPFRPGLYTPYYVPIVKVVNGIIDNDHIYTGTFLAKIIDRDVIYRNIKHDFNNPQLNIYDNTNCAVKIYLYASTSDTNIYFYYNTFSYFNDAIDNNTLQFCYYQSIIINNVWYNVIKIDKTNHRLYIDILSSSNIFNNGELYEITISAANVNNINLISNNHKLRTSHAIDYPFINYTYDKPARLTSLFKGSNDNKYIFNFKDANIGPCTSPYYFTPKSINSSDLLNTVNYINNNNYELERYDYYENYIPLIENLYVKFYDYYGGSNIPGGDDFMGYNFYQVPLDAAQTFNNLMLNVNGVDEWANPDEIEYNLGNYPAYAYRGSNLPVPRFKIVDNILLQEITTDGTIYQHFITISKTNYHIKITNTCFFQNIETSFFYLNNVIPCIVTKYNNIILMQPDYHFYREINQTSRKMIDLIYTVKLEQSGSPIYTNNKWKYHCKHLLGPQYSSIDKEIFNKMEIFVNNKAASYEYDQNEYFYIYLDDYLELITEFTYNTSTCIDSIIPDTTTIKSEYSSLTIDELEIMTDINNDYNLRFGNVLNLSKSNATLLSFKDQTSPTPVNINFGDIDDTNYIGKSNRITYSAIQTDNTYNIDTLYSVLDVSTSTVLYSILTNLSIVKPLYYVLEPEISTSVPALELLINDEGLSTISLLNESKDWNNWTLITTRHNIKLEPYLNNYDLIYNGTSFTTLASTSYFTNDEITKMKSFMTLMYNNTDAQAILTELYLVEQYLLEQIIYYITQRYFWDDIINILKKVVANYDGNYNWTITNNVLCIENEFTNYPEHFELIGDRYYRTNYLSIDYTINYAYLTTKIKISRDPVIIDTNIGYIINADDTYNLYGTNINNVINTLINYGSRINKIKSPLPIYYKYMDSVKYYIAKLFFDIFNTNNYKFNNLLTFNRTINLDSNYQYYGKYYDYYFNKRYYGVDGFNQYNELNTEAIDTIYVEGNIINTLYSSAFNETTINKLNTNNIFKYIIDIKNEGYESTDLIKASNIYSIDIKDNYNHLVDPTIDNVYINTNSLEFSTTEMVQPTDISILSSEPYTFSKFDYGLVMVATTNSSTLNNIYTITSNNIPILFIEQNSTYNYDIAYNSTIYKSDILSYVNSSTDSTINLRTSSLRYNYIIINNTMYVAVYNQTINNEDKYTISNYILPFEIGAYYDFISFQSASKATNKVVVKTSTYSMLGPNKITYITFSANYTSDFVYITINNVVYQINNSGGYYISGHISITTNIIYEVFKTFNISLISTDYNYVSELTLNRDIKPIKYNQVDIDLPMTFSIDNTTINKVEIITSNKIRLTYNIIDTTKSIGSTLYHKYRLNESIPYSLSTITPESKYYYTIPNTYKITTNDTINFDLIYYIKTTTIVYTTQVTEQITDYETVNPITIISTTSDTVITNELTTVLPTDGTTTVSTSSSTINNQWIDQGCHWDGGNSNDPYPGGPIAGETYIRTINATFQSFTSLSQAITIAEAANSNVLGLQYGSRLFINNTLTTTWPYRYNKYDASQGVPSTCSAFGGSWINHVYTLKKTTTTTISSTTTTISHTVVPLNINIYGISNNIITFNTDTYYIIDDLNKADMIIVKSYDIENEIVSQVGTTMVINIPDNLVNTNSVYSLDNGSSISILSIVFSEYIIITTSTPVTSITNLKLIQTVTDTNHTITQNKNNQEFTIVTTNNSSYDNKSPYFIPIIQCLDTNLNEFNAKYYYNFEYTGPFPFDGFIFINYNDIFVKAIIIMIQDTIAIVGTNSYIEPGLLTIYSADISESQNINLLNQYYPYNMGTLLEQTNNTTYKILLPKDSMFEYNINDNTTTNKVIMTFRYSEMNLNNITYPLVGFNKVPDIITSTTTNTTNYLDIDWIENIGVKLFKSIELLIDDNIVEKINFNIYGIFGYYILNEFKRADFNNLTKIRQNEDKSYYYYNLPIPIMLENYLPISSMGRSTIKIKFTLEKLENLINSNINSNINTYTKNVIPSIDFNYSFMTVDNNVLNKFKKTELLLTSFYYYQNYLLNKEKEYNHISLLNRTLEIFFIAKTKNDENNYTTSVDKDNWYNEYLSNNPNDSYVFNIVDAEIAANSYRYNVLKNHLIIKNYNTRFAMYLDTKYLNHINENLNNTNLKFSNKLTILSLYFQNIYKNTTILTPVDIIDKLNISINGKEILPELPSSYHNNVISYYKGLALPFGYFMYGFNYHGLSTQPNGFINMKKIRDFLIYSSQTNTNQEYKLKICTREYKILKIDNLMGQLL